MQSFFNHEKHAALHGHLLPVVRGAQDTDEAPARSGSEIHLLFLKPHPEVLGVIMFPATNQAFSNQVSPAIVFHGA
jgi:hypothetical protein